MSTSDTVTVMSNNTAFLPTQLRRALRLKSKDRLRFVIKKKSITIEKAPSSWSDLKCSAREIYNSYGGGEAYLKKEREAWTKNNSL